MYPFRCLPRAMLSAQADFQTETWLNIYFLASDRETIPFHLSLRREEGLAVLNSRDRTGWKQEIRYPLPPFEGALAFRIGFTPGRASVWLEDRLLCRYPALPFAVEVPPEAGGYRRPEGFPGLWRVREVQLLGGLEPGTLQLRGAAPLIRPRGLQLTDALEVEYRSARPERAPYRLEIAGEAEALPAPLLPLPEMDLRARQPSAAMAVLPGRFWIGRDRLALTLRDATGAKAAAMTLTRAGLARHLERILPGLRKETGAFRAVQLVEHAARSGLAGALSPRAASALGRAAEATGLTAWLADTLAAQGLRAPLALPPEDPNRPQLEKVEAIRADLMAQMRQAEEEGRPFELATALDTALQASPLTTEFAQILLRGLVEPACLAGQIEALEALARRRGLLPLPASETQWQLSSALPFDALAGDWEAIRARLTRMRFIPEDWPITPAIGFALSRTMADAPPEARDAVIEAFLGWLNRQGQGYWSRSPCRTLIGAMAGLLARAEILPAGLAQSCRAAALHHWGLSPEFWSQPALAPLVSGPLAPAREVAEAIFAATRLEPGDPARLLPRLAEAEALGITEAARFRREVFGALKPEAAGEGPEIEAALLRWLFHPLASRDAAAPNLADIARRATIAAYVQLPAAPEGHDPERDARAAREALQVLAQGTPPGAALLGDLKQLASPDPALHLAAALAGRGRHGEVPALLDLASSLPSGPATALALAALSRHAPEAAARAAAQRGLALPAPKPTGATSLHDTLVAVYSCKAYLDTRVAEARKGWLSDLAALGIPYLIFTGDGGPDSAIPEGKTRLDGDVVALDAPDDYEGLPDKSLALFRWVLENTGYARVVKVDDDCHLQADAWFGDFAPLRHDFYGRPLTRVPGQLDRRWHMAKSRSERGQLELDKSPEPSRYCDGGSGYMLSRPAMAALGRAAASPEGQRLRQVSFLEDKLVGDLLALEGIRPSGEAYRSAVLRRTTPGGPLVPAWENGPLPWAGGPVKLVHLDDAARLRATHEAAKAPLPTPGKIWPGFQPPRFGSRSNTLDLLSPAKRLAEVARAEVTVVACLRNEAFLLPHFLAHYRAQGVGGFLIADNGSDDGTLETLLGEPDVAVFAVDTEYGQSAYGVAWQQALLANFRVGKWSLLADADEFLVWTQGRGASLPGLTRRLGTADAARVLMLDMYPEGALSSADFSSGDPFAEAGFVDREPFLRRSTALGPFSNGSTLTSALRHRLIPGSRPELFVAQKYALLRYRPWMRLSAGLHYLAEAQVAERELLFAHFKYNAAFRAKAEAEVARRQHFNNAEEYRAYLALVSEGRERVFEPGISVPWNDAPEVRRRLE